MLRIPSLSQWCREENGTSLIEYALLGSLIAVVSALAITSIGANTLALYTAVCDGVAAATGKPPC